MRKLATLALIYISLFSTDVKAQIVNGLDTLYGYEWINADQSYARLEVEEDGFYRIDYEQLTALGWPVSTINSQDFQLYSFGEPIYFHASNGGDSPLQAGDYLLFYGEKNRGELDHHLFRDADNEQLNPYYSLYSDKAAYFLTWSEGAGTAYTTWTNDLSNPPTAADYIWREVNEVFTGDFMKEYQRFSGVTLYYSHFGIGEGYGSRSINELLSDGETVQEISLDLPSAYTSGPDAQLETRYTAALFAHIQQLSVNGTILRTDSFDGWRMINTVHTLPTDVLSSGTAQLKWEGTGGPKDEVSIGYAKVRYPASPDADGETTLNFELEANGLPQYLEIADVNLSSAVVYDLTNGLRIPVENIDGGLLRVLLPAANGLRQLAISAENEATLVDEVAATNLSLPDLNAADYVILTHSLLREEGDPVQTYADYRSTPQGGGYSTAVVNIDDLFDQFAYGVSQHPIAIRNFVIWHRKQHPTFNFLFIVGKGREYINIRTTEELEEALGTTLFVPSFGFPASDNLLTSKLDKPTPEVCIGRLPAISPTEVAQYLTKMQGLEMEVATGPQTIDGKSWTKNLLHLGGGTTPSERLGIQNHLMVMEEIALDNKMGASTTSFFKSSTDPIETSQSEQIFGRINEGISLLTFFGHSSAGIFDFNIDNPENYANLNRYPMMMSLGCYSGNMFDDFRSIGERFIFLENRGAGTFAASRGVGFIHALGDFGKTFYTHMGTDNYGGTIGEGIKATITEFEDFTDLAYGSLNEQFSLQGDPAFRLNPSDGPDFTFEPGSVQFNPTIINAQKDSFLVSVNLYNLGQHVEDSISVTVIRELPSGETDPAVLILRIPAPDYLEELSFNLPTYGKDGIGVNKIRLLVNPTELGNAIPELPMTALQNNEYLNISGQQGATFLIIDNTALPVWPPDYALVGQQDLTLKASTADALAPVRKYVMEIDTTPYFANPLQRSEISQLGGVIDWSPDITYLDSTVYYWRISPDSLEVGTNGYVWEESSFTFINDIPSGWGQSHWGQYAENELESLEVEPEKQLEYITSFKDLTIKNTIYTVGNAANNRPSGAVSGTVWSDFFRWNVRPSLQVVVIDTVGDFWFNESPGQYGSVNTSTANPIAAFSFRLNTTADRAHIVNFLADIIPDNHTVIVYNAIRTEVQDLWIQEWAADSITLDGRNIFNVLEAQGATSIRDLLEGSMRPYLFAYVKGGGGLTELLADGPSESIFYNIDIPGRWTQGRMEAKRIGPVQAWNSLEWNIEPQSSLDSIQLQLYGIGADGGRISLFSTEEEEGSWDLSTISATDFPYLELDFYSEDRIDKTCADLAYWRILYQDLPDLALNGNLAYSFESDTLQQGQQMAFEIAVSNISEEAIAETIAELSLSDANQNETRWEVAVPALAAGEDVILSTEQSTQSISGPSQLFVTINAPDTPQERLRVNNQALKDFYVSGDVITPVVSVSFDGESILDGDLVSSKPFVQIQLSDENPYLLLNDTSLFSLQWRDPLGNEQTLNLNSPEVNFVPATSLDDNTAKIDWRPEFTQDGEYLLTVRGKDRAGNEARLWHETSFEVITEQMISNVLPYPNPFSTATRFVYTLTGDRPPTQYKLQIMTISGRIVREIQQEELGDLKVGSHLTDFVWDGTDAYGDQLANGTYLYRFITENEEGERIKNYDNGTNRFFKNQIGKVVILR